MVQVGLATVPAGDRPWYLSCGACSTEMQDAEVRESQSSTDIPTDFPLRSGKVHQDWIPSGRPWEDNVWSCESKALAAWRPQELRDARYVEYFLRKTRPHGAATSKVKGVELSNSSGAYIALLHAMPQIPNVELQHLMFAWLFGLVLVPFLLSM